METNRRNFFKWALLTGSAPLADLSRPTSASAPKELNPDRWGVLVDVTLCIGCRACEWACKKVNQLPCDPLETFGDQSVFKKMRRPDGVSYTIVNRYPHPENPEQPIYVKFQCMHCDYPACVSACPVGAVNYNAWKCIGCRYCMVACPFQIPAYEYFNALNPRVRKCTFCFERVTQKGDIPGCVKICPQEVMVFGRRQDLIIAAHKRIAEHPDLYMPHLYGEHEIGGTSWMYLAQVPFEKLGYFTLGKEPVTRLPETVQHAIFKYFIPPLSLYSLLGALMWILRDKGNESMSTSAGKGSNHA
jgi:formate dehydrogenase iron-sulfur subunit